MSNSTNICNELSGQKREYCIMMANSCAEQHATGKKEWILDMMDGVKLPFNDLIDCQDYAKFRASLNVPKGFKIFMNGGKKSEKVILMSNTANAQDTSHPAFKKCDEVGPKGSSAYKYCENLMGTCTAKDAGPYSIPCGSSNVKLDDQDECIDYVIFLSKLQTPKTNQSSSSATPSTNAKWEIDNETTFGAQFAKVGFYPEINDKILIKPLTLLFEYEGTKGIEIKLAYKITKNGGGSYTLNYRIYSEDSSIPKNISISNLNDSIQFSMHGNQIKDDLAFGVKLNGKGKFGSVNTIKIVKL